MRRKATVLAVLAGAVAVAAVSAGAFAPGQLGIGSGRFPAPDDVPGEPRPTGVAVELARGTDRGLAWAVYAQQSDKGLCLQVEYSGQGVVAASGGGCGFGVPDQRALSFTTTYIEAGPLTVLAGPTTETTRSVDVNLTDGRTYAVPTRPLPQEAAPGRYFVRIIPGRAGVRSLVGRSADAAETGRLVAG